MSEVENIALLVGKIFVALIPQFGPFILDFFFILQMINPKWNLVEPFYGRNTPKREKIAKRLAVSLFPFLCLVASIFWGSGLFLFFEGLVIQIYGDVAELALYQLTFMAMIALIWYCVMACKYLTMRIFMVFYPGSFWINGED